MYIALCDDNKDWLETEAKYIECMGDRSISYDKFDSGEKLIDVYNNRGCIYDAVLLDMEMNMINGINTANIIRSKDRRVLIVFVTSHKKYMQQSFECLPFRFLLKPIDFNEFKTVFGHMLNEIEADKRAITFNEGHNTVRLLYEDILFFQSIAHCICIKTVDRLYQTYSLKMSELQAKLNDARFVRVHRSYIINITHIQKINDKTVQLRGYVHDIPVSIRYREELKKRVMLLEERRHLS